MNSCIDDKTVTINKQYRAIKAAVLKSVLQDYITDRCIVPLPTEFFPTGGTYAVGFHLHILEVVAEMLLQFDIDDIALKPDIVHNDEGKRVLTHPASAMAYESHYKYIRKRFPGMEVYPLCIMLSGDEVQINKKGTMGCKPWYVSIGNVKGEKVTSESNIQCIGYSPETTFAAPS